MSQPAALVRQMARNLQQTHAWAEKAAAYAAAKSFDADLLLQMRLAPDMFPLVRQLGSACDTAKLCGARLSGIAAPVHADDQKTWGEVRARVTDVVSYLEKLGDGDFAGAADRKVTFAWLPNKYIGGVDYLHQFALPNFYFHMTTAYGILRHNGVDVGKMDFLGTLPFHDA